MKKIEIAEILRRQRAARALSAESAAALRKVDVPEVEAEIATMAPLVAAVWREGAEAALREVAARAELLEALRGRRDREFTQDTIVAFLLSLFVAFERHTVDATVVLEAARRLVEAGWATVPESDPDYGRAQALLITAAADDLRFWLQRRFREREQTLRAAISEWEARPDETRTTEALLEALEPVVGDPHELASAFLTDLWGYRTFNAAVALSAATASVEELELFNNPRGGGPDTRTTPFCASVHGMVFSAREMWGRYSSYYDAVARGSSEDAKEALPLLSAEQAKRGRGAIRNIGPPPYHGRCRTILRVRRRR